jgi:hypothetical protein
MLINGNEEKMHKVHVATVSSGPNIKALMLKGLPVPCRIDGGQVSKFFEALNKRYAPTTYRNVKNSAEWKANYGVAQHNFTAISKAGTHSIVIADATSCRVCGLLLPLTHLTVDHQKAQVGGELASVLRVFRGFGLTVAGPTGGKGKATATAVAISLGGTVGLGGSRADRYTLNLAGIIYYSVFRIAKAIDDLTTVCMHHPLNLRPVCGPCNSSLQNQNVF